MPILRAFRPGGSSPLTRGKLEREAREVDSSRLIPAHAGKTEPFRACRRGDAAHPRSRGENTTRSCGADPSRGSSPLTRGKLDDAHRAHSLGRLIPAHAGKTGHPLGRGEPGRAHPRSRGENVDGEVGVFAGCGSSPLTRGKLPVQTPDQSPVRLIPAHAGKTG